MLMELAVIAPVLLALPRAVTHSPTARFEALALLICVKRVFVSVVTCTVVLGGVVVVVVELEELDLRKPPVWKVPWTVNPLPETPLTVPNARLKFEALGAPAGREPEGKLRLVPPEPDPSPLPPKKAPPPPPPGPPKGLPAPDWLVQVPLDGVGSTTTELAVTCLLPLELGVPVTVTHAPSVTEDELPVTV